MSNPALADVLTPDRLADLRLIAIDATRRNGAPWELQPIRRNWLAKHEYIAVRPAPAGATFEQRRACVTVTAKGWRAIAADDARKARGMESTP